MNKLTTKLSLVLETNTFVFGTVRLLSSLICPNVNVTGQFPKCFCFVFVWRIEEAGFKEFNKCL